MEPPKFDQQFIEKRMAEHRLWQERQAITMEMEVLTEIYLATKFSAERSPENSPNERGTASVPTDAVFTSP